MTPAQDRDAEPDPVGWVRDRWAERGLPDPERFALAASLMRSHHLVITTLDEALRPHELSRTAYLLLATLSLADNGARSLSYLARYLLVHQTTVTQLVDRLEARGLLARRPHPSDRRTTLAALTPAGETVLEAATADAAAAGFGLGPASAGAVRAAADALDALRGAVGDRATAALTAQSRSSTAPEATAAPSDSRLARSS